MDNKEKTSKDGTLMAKEKCLRMKIIATSMVACGVALASSIAAQASVLETIGIDLQLSHAQGRTAALACKLKKNTTLPILADRLTEDERSRLRIKIDYSGAPGIISGPKSDSVTPPSNENSRTSVTQLTAPAEVGVHLVIARVHYTVDGNTKQVVTKRLWVEWDGTALRALSGSQIEQAKRRYVKMIPSAPNQPGKSRYRQVMTDAGMSPLPPGAL